VVLCATQLCNPNSIIVRCLSLCRTSGKVMLFGAVPAAFVQLLMSMRWNMLLVCHLCDVLPRMHCWHTYSVSSWTHGHFGSLWIQHDYPVCSACSIACLYQQHCCNRALWHCRCVTVYMHPKPRLHAGSSPVLKSPVGHEGAAALRHGWQRVAWVISQCFVQGEPGNINNYYIR